MTIQITGTLTKMHASLENQSGIVQYQLSVGDTTLPLNQFIGKTVTLAHTGNIFCCSCGKKTKKSYAQGHCYICMKKRASCDMCIMKPETCHFSEGTCREPEWGERNCFVDHYVYLSNTSGIKVGITRYTQIPTRWIDQGATQGLVIAKVKSRLISGLVEIELAKLISDKTNWRTLLKGTSQPLPLKEKAAELLPQIEKAIITIKEKYGEDAVELLDTNILKLAFPVDEYPTKIVSHNFDKDPIVTGILRGIKGQYLLFDTGVINIRKFGSYEVKVTA